MERHQRPRLMKNFWTCTHQCQADEERPSAHKPPSIQQGKTGGLMITAKGAFGCEMRMLAMLVVCICLICMLARTQRLLTCPADKTAQGLMHEVGRNQ